MDLRREANSRRPNKRTKSMRPNCRKTWVEEMFQNGKCMTCCKDSAMAMHGRKAGWHSAEADTFFQPFNWSVKFFEDLGKLQFTCFTLRNIRKTDNRRRWHATDDTARKQAQRLKEHFVMTLIARRHTRYTGYEPKCIQWLAETYWWEAAKPRRSRSMMSSSLAAHLNACRSVSRHYGNYESDHYASGICPQGGIWCRCNVWTSNFSTYHTCTYYLENGSSGMEHQCRTWSSPDAQSCPWRNVVQEANRERAGTLPVDEVWSFGQKHCTVKNTYIDRWWVLRSTEVTSLCGFWDGSCDNGTCGAGKMIAFFTKALGWVTHSQELRLGAAVYW